MHFKCEESSNLDKCILNANWNFGAIDKRGFLGIISIHVGDLLISGSSDFTDYNSWEMKEKIEAVSYAENQETYLRIGIKK